MPYFKRRSAIRKSRISPSSQLVETIFMDSSGSRKLIPIPSSLQSLEHSEVSGLLLISLIEQQRFRVWKRVIWTAPKPAVRVGHAPGVERDAVGVGQASRNCV